MTRKPTDAEKHRVHEWARLMEFHARALHDATEHFGTELRADRDDPTLRGVLDPARSAWLASQRILAALGAKAYPTKLGDPRRTP